MTAAQAVLGIVPARGGSKRLPRKNIIDFLGRPILAYTIDAARDSGCFDRLVVSTDDDEIADIARSCGALVDRRPAALATDEAGLVDVCLDLLDREASEGRSWPAFACLYATAPLRNAADIRATLALLEADGCDFSMAVTGYERYPHQALTFGPGGRLEAMWPDLVALRSTALPPLRGGNGSTYAARTEAFRRHRTFYGPGLRGHDMPSERSIDIDTRWDLDLAVWTAARLGLGDPAGAASRA